MNQSDKLQEAAEALTAKQILETYHPIKHDIALRTDLWPTSTVIDAMKEYAYALSLSKPDQPTDINVGQSEPYGYIFEDKFYKDIPERTYSEHSKPTPVYLKPEKEEEWISVETKLPAAGLDVLVADIESDIVCTGWHIEPEGWFTNVIGVTVTHWTKLPKSPK